MSSGAEKNKRITFDGTPETWSNFRWQVRRKLKRLGIRCALELTKRDVQDAWIEDKGEEKGDEFEKAYDKADEFISEALRGRATGLVVHLDDDDICTLWTTLASAFEGTGVKTTDALFQQVDDVDIGSTPDSIMDAIATWDRLYSELRSHDEETTDARKISLFRRKLRPLNSAYNVFYQTFMMTGRAEERTWARFCVGIRIEAAHLQMEKKQRTPSTAMMATANRSNNNKFGKQNGKKRLNGACWNCEKPGHPATLCRDTCHKPDCGGAREHKRKDCRSMGKDLALAKKYGQADYAEVVGALFSTTEPDGVSDFTLLDDEVSDNDLPPLVSSESDSNASDDVSSESDSEAVPDLHDEADNPAPQDVTYWAPSGGDVAWLSTPVTPLRILDSGCGSTLLSGREQLYNKESRSPLSVKTAGKDVLHLNEKAKAKVNMTTGEGKKQVWELTGTVAPDLPATLLSVSALDKKGKGVMFGNGMAYILKQPMVPNPKHVLGTASLVSGGVYALVSGVALRGAGSTETGPLFHDRGENTVSAGGDVTLGKIPDELAETRLSQVIGESWPRSQLSARSRNTPNQLAVDNEKKSTKIRVSQASHPEAAFAFTRPTKQIKKISAMVLHARLGHAGSRAMASYCKKNNMTLVDEHKLDNCMACRLGKAKDRSYKKIAHLERSCVPGEYWHIDLIGPFRVLTLGRKRFALICTDDASGYRIVYLLTTKGEQIKTFLILYAWTETQLGVKIKIVRTDGDWTSLEWIAIKEEKGLRQFQTTTNHPRSNPVAERSNGIIDAMARCLLIDAGLPPTFYGEALVAAAYISNRIFSSRAGQDQTPVEKALAKRECHDLELRAYGSHAWVTKTTATGHAGSRAHEGILVGYDEQQRGYRVFCPSERRIFVSDAVVFDETTIGIHQPRKPWKTMHDLVLEPHTLGAGTLTPVPLAASPGTSIPVASPIESKVPVASRVASGDEEGAMDVSIQVLAEESSTPVTRSTRSAGSSLEWSKKWGVDLVPETKTSSSDALYAAVYDDEDPTCFALLTQAVDLKEDIAWGQSKWKVAMQKELDALKKLGTYEVVLRRSIPQGQKAIGARWVLVEKGSDDDLIAKARVVAKGYSQIPGKDFFETWSPTVRRETARLIVALAAAEGDDVQQLDVKNAFVNAPLEECIYMERPFGSPGNSDQVWLLHKAIYGLKQAGRAWYQLVSRVFIKLGFKKCISDPCLFVGTGKFKGVLIGVYVDDLLVKYRGSEKIRSLVTALGKHFPIKDMGKMSNFVGLQVIHTDSQIKLHQEDYAAMVLKRFGYENSNPVPTPAAKGDVVETLKPHHLSKFEMSSIVGALLYLSLQTRPDITYATAKLAQTVAVPTPADFKAAARILRYLNGTRDKGLIFKKNVRAVLSGYVDSDWAGDYTDARSQYGFLLFVGGPVSWASRKINSVSLSSSEAELIGAVEVGRVVLWFRSVFEELGIPSSGPTVIFEDNSGAIVLATTNVLGKRTRHINIKYHCINDWTARGYLVLNKISTTDNLADIMTKALARVLFQRFAVKLVA